MSRNSRRCWSKSIGERGHRVRLYEARPGGPIMRSVFVAGKEVRKSLGHRDKEQAVQQGYELLTALLGVALVGRSRRQQAAPGVAQPTAAAVRAVRGLHLVEGPART